MARLIAGVRDGLDPEQVDVRVKWADAATRSIAQAAEALDSFPVGQVIGRGCPAPPTG